MTAGPSRRSDHFDGKRFFNPNGVDTDRSLKDMWRWSRNGAWSKWPPHVGNGPTAPPPAAAPDGAIAITFIGQSTFLLQVDGCSILTDPMFSERASPFVATGPKRVRPPGVALEALPAIDVILLSHNHYDHMDLPSLRALQARNAPTIVTGLRNGRYLAGKGIANVVERDWWQAVEPRPGIRVTYAPAQHWSRRGLFDRRRMLWGGHVVEAPAGRIYFAGDTGYGPHFREIARRLGPLDIALLPIGAYEPRWFMEAQHMNPEDAVRAHLDLQPRLSIAMHFATFQLTDEAIDAPIKALELARRAHGVPPEQLRVPAFGETLIWRN